jgi:rhodanese-related sulfurtransferase
MSRTLTAADLKPLLSAGRVTVLDVRRQNDFDADPLMLPGAQRCNPEDIDTWSRQLHSDQDIVLYCARGGSVSNSVLDALLTKQLKARYIEGGIVAWEDAGGETVA